MQRDSSASYGATPAHSRDATIAADPGVGGYGNTYRPGDDERARLLGPRTTDDRGVSTSSGSGKARPNSRPGSWLFSGISQSNGKSLLPTSTVQSPEPSPDQPRISKELPGQTLDPKDPLNRSTSIARTTRERLTRQESHRSAVSTGSHRSNYAASISARRNQLHRQNSFGVPPNRFLELVYWLRDLTTSTDTTDEKVASTVLNVVNVFVDAAFCILYLIEASSLERPPGHESHWLYIERSPAFWHLLVTIALYNFITVCCAVAFSESKSVSLRSTRHIVSTFVAVPFILSIFMKDGHTLYVPYFLQSFSLTSRVQQALNFYIDIGVSDLPMDPLKSKTIVFAMYITTMIYCSISAFQIAEYDQLMDSDDHNNVLKLLYFVLITMSTIGYGDVTPKNQLGYAIVVLIIFTVVTVFPFMISGIMDAIAQAKAGEGIFKSGGHKFMIISGSLHSAQKLANVLNGFWFTNKEYSNAAFKIVILGLSEPTKDIQALLQSARYKNRVVYLKGTPLESKDLDRIQAKYAEGIFIIADRNSAFTPQEEDRHNTLSTLAFRNVSDSGIYTYNLLPESEIFQKMAATQVVCADELRQVLLAFNCLQQATATLILNMLHQHRPSEKFTEAWEAEYDDSLGNEFYISYLNPIFDGKPFGFVSWFLYRRFQVILFGVRIRLQSGEYHTALNPGKDYKFQHNEQCIFIAQNPTDLDDINELTEKYLENFIQHLHDTYQEDCDTIGFDYHARSFTKALLTLDPRNLGSGKQRKPRATPWAVQSDTGSYSRRAGGYQLHSAMPTITNEDDEIDVEPEVNLMSETEGSGIEQGPLSPITAVPEPLPEPLSEAAPITPAVPVQNTPPAERQPKFRNGSQREMMMKMRFRDSETDNMRIDYPVAPFPGAKVPLCILVESRTGIDRKVSEMVISSWQDVIDERAEKAEQESASASMAVGESSTSPGRAATANQASTGGAGPKTSTQLGHILICSPNYDVFRLICTLRSAHVKQLQDIVILCSRQPNPQEFKVLKCFPRLYFLIGDCLSREDLEKRGAITKSSKYLFMRHPENAGVDGSFFDSAAVINRILVQQIFSDLQVSRVRRLGPISSNRNRTKTQPMPFGSNSSIPDPLTEPQVIPPQTKRVTIDSLNEGPQCVYELVEERSVEFLQLRKSGISIGGGGQGEGVAVMEGAGGALEPSFGPEADSSYYGTPAGQKTRNQLLKKSGPLDFYHNPIYASGGVIVGGLLDHELYQLYSNPSILQLIKLLCGIRTKADVKRDFHLFKQYGAGCYLECIPMPEGFGVQTIRKSRDDDSSGSNTSSSDSESSSDEEMTASLATEDKKSASSRQKKSINKHDTDSTLRATSMGKQKVSDLFKQHHHHHRRPRTHRRGSSDSSHSMDSNYMYDNRHKNFLHLYEHLALDQGVIPIGLLRLQGDDPKTVHLGIGGSSRCYAITNPLLDTILLDTDQVFVLTREGI
ncbi:hypothetical protein BGZ99_008206 [Dissophora globulifera]|uniref:Uncharacterized protein n=1 Tax=Dissophora globulifera TaxID=979702 RepID=A0A9P6R9V7_9FUNG|nr:hypothetical protein BGZ99_008206 [Dissophora globulifera]